MKFKILIPLFIAISVYAAAPKATPKPPTPKPTVSESKTISDYWYTMQAGSSPWGYFHETIEKREGKYYYRSELVKREATLIYQENVGAIAQAEDLRPITFNLSKNAEGATEIIDGTYAEEKNSGVMKINISGGRVAKFTRRVPKGTIFEVFFPIWLAKRWDTLKPKTRGSVQAFTEDPISQEFMPKTVRYVVGEKNFKDNCLSVDIELNAIRSTWCIQSEGQMVSMDINQRQVVVRRAKNEQEAKAFLPR